MWSVECSTSGLMILVSSFAIPYVTAPLQKAVGLRGGPFVDLGQPIEFGEPPPVG